MKRDGGIRGDLFEVGGVLPSLICRPINEKKGIEKKSKEERKRRGEGGKETIKSVRKRWYQSLKVAVKITGVWVDRYFAQATWNVG